MKCIKFRIEKYRRDEDGDGARFDQTNVVCLDCIRDAINMHGIRSSNDRRRRILLVLLCTSK